MDFTFFFVRRVSSKIRFWFKHNLMHLGNKEYIPIFPFVFYKYFLCLYRLCNMGC